MDESRVVISVKAKAGVSVCLSGCVRCVQCVRCVRCVGAIDRRWKVFLFTVGDIQRCHHRVDFKFIKATKKRWVFCLLDLEFHKWHFGGILAAFWRHFGGILASVPVLM